MAFSAILCQGCNKSRHVPIGVWPMQAETISRDERKWTQRSGGARNWHDRASSDIVAKDDRGECR